MATNGTWRRRVGIKRARGWVAALLGLAALALPTTALAVPPTITSMPALGGASATVGQPLDGTAVVDGSAPLTVTYQWEGCSAGPFCTAISGGAGAVYTPTALDVGLQLRVLVSATNGEAPDVPATASDLTGAVQQPTPRVVAPTVSNVTITGSATVGGTLTANADITGDAPLDVTYNWQKCDGGGANCSSTGTTTQNYGVTLADVGSTFVVTVSATNAAGGPVSATSSATGVVPIPLVGPSFVTGPSISGNAVVGQTLTVVAPTVLGVPAPDLDYTWLRCSPGCGQVATGPSYTLVGADEGATIKVSAHAHNSSGDATQESAPTGVVAAPPQITGGPSISNGSPVLGSALTASATASGTPAPSLTFTWLSCDAGGNDCVLRDTDGTSEPIKAYTPGAADVGRSIVVEVVAGNGVGQSAPARSGPTALVGQAAFALNATISGALVAGSTLQVNVNTGGFPAPDVVYRWQRCTSTTGGSCSTIAGADTNRYTLTNADAGNRIRVQVSAGNAYGSGQDNSPISGVVAAPPAQPGPSTAPKLSTPTISGIAVVGQALKADAAVTGNPTPTLAFQWQRCDATGNACADIAGAAGGERTVVDADLGSTLRVVVIAANGVAPDATGRSDATAVVQAVGPGGTLPSGSAFDTSSGASTTPTGRSALAPFPQVRIRGKLVKGGAKVTLFAVSAPVGTRISIHCTGRGCPKVFVRNARSKVTRVGRYERFLRAGMHIKVRISRTGFIGKYSSFVIRDRKAPIRSDLCLTSPTAKPIRCGS